MSSPARDPAARFAEAFEPVRLRLFGAGLLGQAGAAGAASLALTAIGRGDGVTTVALGCALATARRGEGPVLLLDGTPLGRRCADMLGVAATSMAPEAGSEQLDSNLLDLPALGLHLLQLAGPPPRAGEPAGAPAWTQLWATLGQRYRHIVIDAGSLRSDAPLRWAGWAAHSALVIDTTHVTREAMEALRREQRHGGPALAGFILNKRAFPVPARLYRALS